MKLKILMLSEQTYQAQKPVLDQNPVLEELYSKILPDRGHKITLVMHSLKKSYENKKVYWNEARAYLTVDRLPRKSRLQRLINNIFNVLDEMRIVHRLLKSEKFDIVQARNGVMVGLLGAYLKKKYEIKFSFRYTDPVPEADIYAFKTGIARYPLIYLFRGMISKPILMWIMRKADLVLPVSKGMKQYLIENGVPEKKMMVFPMGVDISISPNRSEGDIKERDRLSGSPTVIYVGTMIKQRNLSFFIYAMSKVKKKISDVKLLMVGDGDDRPDLETLSKSLGLEDNVIFTGSVPHSQVYEFIASADIGVAPIIQHYIIGKLGMCTKAVEYMAMGKAFVATDSSPDLVEDVKISNAGICTRYDVDDFATAIVNLLENPEMANEMGKRGRQFAEKNYSFEMLASRIEQKYAELLKGKNLLNR